MKKPPRRKCKVCGDWFYPQFANVWWCSPDHGAIYALQVYKRQREKAQAKERSESREQQLADRKAWRQRKAAVKPLKHWIDLTQRAVNDICRETALANGEGCISCGTHQADAWHAGHYRTTAAAGHLRFDRRNIHLQCNSCNIHKSGNIELYRINLVKKIGEPSVQELENDNRMHRWTVEELADIRRKARADLRQLKKERSNDR